LIAIIIKAAEAHPKRIPDKEAEVHGFGQDSDHDEQFLNKRYLNMTKFQVRQEALLRRSVAPFALGSVGLIWLVGQYLRQVCTVSTALRWFLLHTPNQIQDFDEAAALETC
jgi:hypothetical protein